MPTSLDETGKSLLLERGSSVERDQSASSRHSSDAANTSRQTIINLHQFARTSGSVALLGTVVRACASQAECWLSNAAEG
jgi:hypothetical protein